MIIFDLDDTLADYEHRLHYILNPRKDYPEANLWEADWKAFYADCHRDKPIGPTITLFHCLVSRLGSENIEIWSGRCESVRDKTVEWLNSYIVHFAINDVKLKMRPIGDNTPDDVLKEKWLNEYLTSMWPKLERARKENELQTVYRKEKIEFVVDGDLQSIRMWRRRGIFVFDANQTGKEF